MITERTALIKTHDYRPQSGCELPFLSKEKPPMRPSHPFIVVLSKSDYKVPVFDMNASSYKIKVTVYCLLVRAILHYLLM